MAAQPGAPTTYVINLATLDFALLLAALGLLIAMFFYLRMKTESRKALAGFIEATGVDIAFLAASVFIVIYLYFRFPSGNHLAWAVAQVILQGYWLTFAIPIVTVGNSVHVKTRGMVAWRGSSIGVALLLFLIFLYYYYT